MKYIFDLQKVLQTAQDHKIPLLSALQHFIKVQQNEKVYNNKGGDSQVEVEK